jgi:hypothetical protein
MISVIKTDHGTYNLFGTRDGAFCLEGNLTELELEELGRKIQLLLKEVQYWESKMM